MTRMGLKRGFFLTATLLLAVTVSISACGRKGPLERPKKTADAGAAPSEPAPDATVRGPAKPFVLDRLLR